MSLTPEKLESAAKGADEADSLKDQLQRDVASWREGRAHADPREATELSVAVAKPAPVPRAKRAKPAAPAAPVEPAKKKPFGMSYDGATSADYISYRVSRGAR